MAISLPKLVLHFNSLQFKQVVPENVVQNQFLGQKLTFPRLAIRQEATIRPKKNCMSSINEFLPTGSEIETVKLICSNDDEGSPINKEPEKALADHWLDIHGQDDWEGMLDPFDPLLKTEVIRYGMMAQACYDAFDSDPRSKHCGSCRFIPDMFFQGLGLTNGYQVSGYIYATYDISLPNIIRRSLWPEGRTEEPNWMGYVSVSDDETTQKLGRRDITIAWRGTVTKLEWVADLMDFLWPINLKKIPSPYPDVKVETGFLQVYTGKNKHCPCCKYSVREQVLAEVNRLIHKYADEKLSITVTGHSLGSALAILNAYDMKEVGLDVMEDGRTIPICVFSFSGPRVGNNRFKERLEWLGVKVLRVLNIHDKVPKAPGFFLNEHMPRVIQNLTKKIPWCYSHVGIELALDHENSPFLKDTSDLFSLHNLDALLHLVDGYHGKGEPFALIGEHDLARVNKDCDFLKDCFLIKPKWGQDEHRKMAKNQEDNLAPP
ncbi:Fungal lipase-like domain [Dillenia turbinata]|uniref:Fungal lipase-like domain n=1 Tax=Dillenia turbinata TaxID=194707 RepID=A0AAN8YVK4_9MAGN